MYIYYLMKNNLFHCPQLLLGFRVTTKERENQYEGFDQTSSSKETEEEITKSQGNHHKGGNIIGHFHKINHYLVRVQQPTHKLLSLMCLSHLATAYW